jgi:5'-3' exonuclease
VENSKDFPEYENQTYKGDRIKDPSIPWESIDEINKEVINGLKNYSDFQVLRVPLCEADDIIAVLAKDCADNNQECFIHSNDGDFVQSQTSCVHIFNPIKNAFHPEVNIEEYKKLHIMVAGDDNIKNIKRGIGDKKALKLLPTLEETLAIDPEMRARFNFNKKLIDFEEIPEYIRTTIKDEWNIHKDKFNYNPMGLVKLFRKYSLNALGEKMMSFKLTDHSKETDLNMYYKRMKQVEEWSDNTLDAFFE